MRIVGAQQTRNRSMNKLAVLALENSVSGEQVQDAAKGTGVRPRGLRQNGQRSGFVAETIRDSEIRHNLKASRKEVRARDLLQDFVRRHRGHGKPLSKAWELSLVRAYLGAIVHHAV